MSPADKVTHTYHYNAHGHGLSAQFHRPFEATIEVQAGTSLPITGGHGHARVDNFKFKEVVSFKSAYSHVSGSQNREDGSYNTLVTAVVEHLNVLDVVTADRIVARISTHHPKDEKEARIIPLGSKFENLRIAACPVDVELDSDLFCELDTSESFRQKYEKDHQFQKTAQERFLWGELKKAVPDFIRTRYNWVKERGLPQPPGAFVCSLVKDVATTCPGVKRFGHILLVPQFGAVFLAEIICKHSERTLTMLRLELGSPVDGTLTVSGGSGNGTPYPPTG